MTNKNEVPELIASLDVRRVKGCVKIFSTGNEVRRISQ
jgi:hypothetical protein